MFTVQSNVLRCEREVAARVAKEAGLRLICAPWPHSVHASPRVTTQKYWAWEDWALGGGACRITWQDGVVWVSRHSGYAQADLTEEAIFFLEHYGAVPITGDAQYGAWHKNPRIYG